MKWLVTCNYFLQVAQMTPEARYLATARDNIYNYYGTKWLKTLYKCSQCPHGDMVQAGSAETSVLTRQLYWSYQVLYRSRHLVHRKQVAMIPSSHSTRLPYRTSSISRHFSYCTKRTSRQHTTWKSSSMRMCAYSVDCNFLKKVSSSAGNFQFPYYYLLMAC